MFRKLLITILSMTSLFSASVFALGLGEIKQFSDLNQPLNAEIPLLSAGDLAEYEVLASLASNKEFEKVGVERLFFLNKIKFKTERDKNDQIIIRVSTNGPVKEPFLNFVVELNWPNGRILREYTLLLDPPIFETNTSATIEPAYAEPEPQASLNQTQNRPTTAEPRALRSAIESTETQSFSGSSWGPVGSTDTLWRIASSVRPDRSVSIQQTLVAIYRANPDAFSNGNINNLRQGKVLDIPDLDVIQDVPQRAALQDVVLQNRQWRSGGARNIVSNGDSSGSGSSDSSSGSRLTLAATQSGDSSAQGYGSDTAELNEIKDRLNQSQEESATLQAENEALRTRLADILDKVENQGGDSVVKVEDAELAALAQVSEQNQESATESEAQQIDGQALTEAGQTTDSDVDDENPQATDANSELNQNSVADEKPAPSIFKKKVEDKGMFDELLENETLLWGGAGTAAILFFMLVFWRMKKRMEDDDFQDDLVASAGAGSMDTTETFELPDVGDDMLVELDMDDDDTTAVTSSNESFDPLGEADIYIAYGKHEQAKSLLLDSIDDNPVRADLKVKLMECYAETDEQEKFDSLAEEVSEAVDAEDWQEQISAMSEAAWGASSSEDDEDDFDLPSTEDIFGEEDDQDDELDDELDVDFDEKSEADDDFDPFSGEHELDNDDGSVTDEDIEGLETLEELDELQDLDDAESEGDENIDDIDGLDDIDELDDIGDLDDLVDLDDVEGLEDLDDIADLDDSEEDDSVEDILDLDEDNADTSDEDDFVLDDEDDSADDEISLDDDENNEYGLDENVDFDQEESFDEDSLDSDDEIATKLDLARAYVDMGDSDGAKEILEEVIAAGTDEQKAEAQALIDKSN